MLWCITQYNQIINKMLIKNTKYNLELLNKITIFAKDCA